MARHRSRSRAAATRPATLMPDRQNQHNILGREPAIFGDVAIPAPREDQLPPPLLRAARPGERRYVLADGHCMSLHVMPWVPTRDRTGLRRARHHRGSAWPPRASKVRHRPATPTRTALSGAFSRLPSAHVVLEQPGVDAPQLRARGDQGRAVTAGLQRQQQPRCLKCPRRRRIRIRRSNRLIEA